MECEQIGEQVKTCFEHGMLLANARQGHPCQFVSLNRALDLICEPV